MSEETMSTSSPEPNRKLVGWFMWGLAIFGAMVALSLVRPFTDGWDYKRQLIALTLTSMTAGLLFLLAMWSLVRSKPSLRGLTWIIVAGFAMRLVMFTQPLAFETDFYRFMWDGAVTAHGVNPYAYPPIDVIDNNAPLFSTDPKRIALRDAGLPTLKKINHPHLTTIYPPVAQTFFAAAYWLSPFDPNAIRWLLLLTEIPLLVLLAALLRHFKLPVTWIAIYWWNPVTVKEFYLSAHVDVISVLFATASLSAIIWGRRWFGILLLGLAIGTKLWPIVLAPLFLQFNARSSRQVVRESLVFIAVVACFTWPLMACWGRDSTSGVSAYAQHWISNAGFFSIVDSISEWLSRLSGAIGIPLSNLSRFIAAGLFVLWMGVLATRVVPDAKSLTRWAMISVGGLFLVSPTQFPWYYTWVLPFLVVAPSRALLAYSALLPLYHLQYDYPWVLWIEHVPVWLLLAWAVFRGNTHPHANSWIESTRNDFTPPVDQRISVIIPALNEERAIGKVIANIPAWVTEIVVVDNGSTDNTASIAKWAGAKVVAEPRRGYGAACLRGIAATDHPEIIVFMDGDFSDIPQEMARLVEPIVRHESDMVIGSRVLGNAEAGSLTPQQRFGNGLACRLMRLFYGVAYTDLGPFRAIHAESLKRLAMDDQDFGWTVQMQVRAARHGVRSTEVPVSYRRRIGVSKISGTVRGVMAAGTKIITTIFREGFRKPAREDVHEQIIVMARYPEPGRAKTRLIPLLGPSGASLLHRQLVMQTLATVRALRCRHAIPAEVRFTGASSQKMSSMFGADLTYRQQCEGDLGERLYHAAIEAFGDGMQKVMLIGTDCPLLDADTLASGLASLNDHDVVLGPAADGGYYLIGLRVLRKELFQGISWGGSTVLQQTLDACGQSGLTVTLLKELPDVDTPQDLAIWGKSYIAPGDSSPQISIVIPALNEEERLAATIASSLGSRNLELIVADGGSTDRTREIAQAFGATVCSEGPSRGMQLNAGAAAARAPILLFLHADTMLPPGYAETCMQLLGQHGVAAGAFELHLDANGLMPRIIEFSVNLRSRLLQRPYGDQALFMSREVFNRCNGFPSMSYMEDYAMLRRLRALGRIRIGNKSVTTSARRSQSRGWLVTTLRHQLMIMKYHLRGVTAVNPTGKAEQNARTPQHCLQRE